MKIKANVLCVEEHHAQSLNFIAKLDHFLMSNSSQQEDENDATCEQVFLGWISNEWITENNKKANKVA